MGKRFQFVSEEVYAAIRAEGFAAGLEAAAIWLEDRNVNYADAIRTLSPPPSATVQTQPNALPRDGRMPHAFVGRLDRWCEVCNLPDRNPIHRLPHPEE